MTQGVLGIIICPMFDDNLTYAMGKDEEKNELLQIQLTGGVYLKKDKAPYKLLEQDEALKAQYLAKLAAQLDDESVMVREIIDSLSLVAVENDEAEKPVTLRQLPAAEQSLNQDFSMIKNMT